MSPPAPEVAPPSLTIITRRTDMLAYIAIALLALWILGEALGFVVGAVFNLLWIAALVLGAIWLFQKVRA